MEEDGVSVPLGGHLHKLLRSANNRAATVQGAVKVRRVRRVLRRRTYRLFRLLRLGEDAIARCVVPDGGFD